MVSARSFFSRMNQSRNENWLTDAQLLKGSEEFFRSNNYYNIEYNRVFEQGRQIFSSSGFTKGSVNVCREGSDCKVF